MATSLSEELHARIIQTLVSGDIAILKSLEDELLKIYEEQYSSQNDEIKAKAIEVKDGLTADKAKDYFDEINAYYKLVGCRLKECMGKYEAKRKSREEKKNPERYGLYASKAKRARQDIGDENVADGKEVHDFDYMSSKPWFPPTCSSYLKI